MIMARDHHFVNLFFGKLKAGKIVLPTMSSMGHISLLGGIVYHV